MRSSPRAANVIATAAQSAKAKAHIPIARYVVSASRNPAALSSVAGASDSTIDRAVDAPPVTKPRCSALQPNEEGGRCYVVPPAEAGPVQFSGVCRRHGVSCKPEDLVSVDVARALLNEVLDEFGLR